MDTLLSGIDDANRAVILELLQQDSQELMSSATRKGKQKEGTKTDSQLSIELFQEELQMTQTFFADMKMTRSIQDAVQADGDALLRMQREEQVAQQDRNLSISLRNGLPLPPPNIPQVSTQDETLIESMERNYVAGTENVDAILGRLEGIQISKSNDDDNRSLESDQSESSSWAASRQGSRTQERRTCEACRDQVFIFDLYRSPCGHEYCRQCLSSLFKTAMIDESLFPPRCCMQPMPLDKAKVFLDSALVSHFRTKAVEFSTQDRIYCHQRSCAAFIPRADHFGSTASCSKCHGQTCTLCKGVSHAGECPDDDGQLEQVLQLAQEHGWQRCQKCSRMVELERGCNHMTCLCKYEFCYRCGARWKTCACPQWDEERLYDRATQIDARGNANVRQRRNRNAREPARGDDQPNSDPQQRIEAIARNLRVNHQCTHSTWTKRRGSHECEECHDELPDYIYECRRCHIVACQRCRFNRL